MICKDIDGWATAVTPSIKLFCPSPGVKTLMRPLSGWYVGSTGHQDSSASAVTFDDPQQLPKPEPLSLLRQLRDDERSALRWAQGLGADLLTGLSSGITGPAAVLAEDYLVLVDEWGSSVNGLYLTHTTAGSTAVTTSSLSSMQDI